MSIPLDLTLSRAGAAQFPPSQGQEPAVGANLTVVGWGATLVTMFAFCPFASKSISVVLKILEKSSDIQASGDIRRPHCFQ